MKPKKRGRRLLTTLIVLLILLGFALVAADRFGAAYAERLLADRVAEEVAAQRATSDRPQVTVAGVPFLTQVASGDYQEIRIELPNFAGPAGDGRTVRMPLLDIRAADVQAPLDALRNGQGNVVAGRVTGTGTVDYAQLTQLIDQPGLKLAERDGKLVGSLPVEVLGRTVEVAGAANFTIAGEVVQVRFSNVTAEGVPNVPVVRALIDSYTQKLGVDLRVPDLPLKLAVQGVQARPDGLHVTAGAQNVALQAGGL